MRDMFALWNLVSGYDDSLHHYCLFFGGIPAVYKPGAILMENVSGDDAHEQTEGGTWPSDPITWQGGNRYWSDMATNKDLWLTKNHAGVNRFHGWGTAAQWDNGRYVVDFSKTPSGGWAAAVTAAVNACIDCGYGWHGIHWDTLGPGLYSNFREMTPSGLVSPPVYARIWRDALNGTGPWATNTQAMADALDLLSPTSCQIHTGDAASVAFLSCFDRIKLEGFRFFPTYYSAGDGWSQHSGNNLYWSDWFVGHDWGEDVSVLGVQQLEALGRIAIIDACYDPAWSPAKRDAYALMAVATGCLSDTALVVYHELGDPSNPAKQWTAAHDLAVQLGVPLAACQEKPNGTWTRQYDNGVVIVNPTDHTVGGVPANQARIILAQHAPVCVDSAIESSVQVDSEITESVDLG